MTAVTFANPALLPLAALAAIPVILHLIMRHRPRFLDFPTLRFLRMAATETRRARRPRDILVLAMRVVFLLALGLVFARPQAFISSELTGSAGGARDAVLVVDRSLSMGFNERGLTRFAAAAARAREVLDSLPAGSRADLVWLDAAGQPVFGAVSENLPALRAELSRAEPGFSAGAPAAALARAAAILERAVGGRPHSGRRPREIYAISDFQATNWTGVRQQEVAPGLRVFNVLIGHQQEPANAGVVRLAASPAAPVVGERAAISVEVANWSSAAVERSVVLEIGASRQEHSVALAPGGRATAEFEILPREAGRLELAAVIGEDGLPADNRRFLALPVSAAVRVALVAGPGGDQQYLRAALEAPPSFVSVRSLASQAWQLRSAEADEVLFLCGWDGGGGEGGGAQEVAAAAELLDSGRCLVWTVPVEGAVGGGLAGRLGLGAVFGPAVVRGEADPGRLRPARADDPLLAIFRGGDAGDLSSVAFRRYRQLSVEGGRTVLAYDDGVPALVRAELPRGGTLFLWNMPLAPAASGLAGSNFLLPLVRELVRQNRCAASSPAGVAGTAAAVEVPLSVDPAGIAVETPRGAPAAFRFVPGAVSARVELDCVAEPGFWRVRGGGRDLAVQAVNVPEAEGDLRQLSGAELERGGALAIGAGSSVLGVRDGRPLWPLLLALAIAALAAENLLLALWKRET